MLSQRFDGGDMIVGVGDRVRMSHVSDPVRSPACAAKSAVDASANEE